MQVRASTIWAGALVLLLVAAAHMALHWYARRRALRRQSAPSDGGDRATANWLAATLLLLVPPVALLLWIHGLHYALSLVITDIEAPQVTRYAVPLLAALRGIGTLLGLVWLLVRVGRAVEKRLVHIAKQSRTRSDDFFLPIIGTAIRLLLPLLALILGSSALDVPARFQTIFSNVVSMLMVVCVAFVLYRLVTAACDLLLERYRIDVPDNRAARVVYTQVTLLRKVAVSVIVLFGFAALLMVFDPVRQVGATLLASAGVAGIVVGFAAQRSLSTLLAGFQIALTQPIRIDDVVVVEGEWGHIEEITLTYVVVNIWDMRRLVVPITWFLEKPFQNWTRNSTELLCTVELFVDHDMPLQALRQKLSAMLKISKFWNGKVNVLQVTDVREHTVQVRVLVSANDAGAAWDLRCEVREGLLRFLQQEHPASLPRLRLARAARRAPPQPAVRPGDSSA
jgi:small-conductance mechanosensitive channel